MTTRCEPPEAFRHHRWHWLRSANPRLGDWPWRWSGKDYAWFDGQEFASVAQLEAHGWVYLAPAIPPTEQALISIPAIDLPFKLGDSVAVNFGTGPQKMGRVVAISAVNADGEVEITTEDVAPTEEKGK